MEQSGKYGFDSIATVGAQAMHGPYGGIDALVGFLEELGSVRPRDLYSRYSLYWTVLCLGTPSGLIVQAGSGALIALGVA